ncbi:hypothetical protein L9G16_07340 [Shewanella sp. A25]|nr:hypothetical protein [Shewanella shenzhenensis]
MAGYSCGCGIIGLYVAVVLPDWWRYTVISSVTGTKNAEIGDSLQR